MSWEHWSRKKTYTGPLVVIGKTTQAEDFKPSCGLCAVVPWEECGCSVEWPTPPCGRIPEGMPTHSERINAEADERLRLVLGAT